MKRNTVKSPLKIQNGTEENSNKSEPLATATTTTITRVKLVYDRTVGGLA